jgi:hypothetical protein
MDVSLGEELARLRADLDQALSTAEFAGCRPRNTPACTSLPRSWPGRRQEDRLFWEVYAADTEAPPAPQAKELAAAKAATERAPAAEHQARIERAARADRQSHLSYRSYRRADAARHHALI